MISYLNGKIVKVDASGVIVLAVGPVAFEIHAPAQLHSPWKEGEDVRFYTHLLISLERPILYGFDSAYDRDIFRLLLTASQVGPKVALSLLELGGDTIVRAIASGDARTLTAATGIGQKKAERIVLDLKDKVADFSVSPREDRGLEAGASKGSKAESEAIQALIGLGFPHQSALKAVSAAINLEGGDKDAAVLIRSALRNIQNR